MSPATDSSSPLRQYVALIRPANVATALADILAGVAIAAGGWSSQLSWLLPSTACLYAGGIVLNDYFDRALDAIERPERPLPSGRVTAGRAAALGWGLLAAGVGLAAGAGRASLAVAVAITVAVVLYDAVGKRHAFLGPVNMGACRALNLLLGISAVPAALATHAWLALLPWAYIAGVTVLSRGEVAGSRRPVARLSLALIGAVVLWSAWVALNHVTGRSWWALALAALLATRVIPPYWQACADPSPGTIRRAVRAGVLSLVLLDAVLAAAYADIMMSLSVLATALVAGWLARQFAVT